MAKEYRALVYEPIAIHAGDTSRARRIVTRMLQRGWIVLYRDDQDIIFGKEKIFKN